MGELFAAGHFVGRIAECHRVVAAVERASAALIYGVAGIGKTELAHRAAAALVEQPRWAEAQRVIVRVDERFADQLATVVLQRCGRRVPRSLAAEVCLDQLVETLEARPMLVLLDDAHRAPVAAAALLDAIMRGVRNSFVIATSREELPLVTAPIVVRLGPLGAEDATALIRHLAERLDIDGIDAAELSQRCGGSPFVLRHMVAGCARGGTPPIDPLCGSLAALSAAERSSLASLIAASNCPVAGAGLVQIADARVVEELARRFMVQFEQGRIVIHDLVREAFLAIASDDELARARSEVSAAALDRFVTTQQPADAISAVCLATAAGEHAAATSLLARTYTSIAAAGMDHLLLPAMTALSNAGAADVVLHAKVLVRMARIADAEQALAAHATDPRLVGCWRYHALRGVVAQRRGDLAAACRHVEQARQIAPVGRPRGRLTLHLADMYSLAGRFEEAQTLLSQLADAGVAGPDADSDLARRLWSTALNLILEQRFVEAVECARRGRDAAVRCGALDLIHLHGLQLIIAACESGRVDVARAAAAELGDPSTGERLREEVIQLYLGVVALAEGRAVDARARLRRAYDFSARQADEVFACIAGHYLGRALLAVGDAGAAHTCLSETTARAIASGFMSLSATGQVHTARAALSSRRLDVALENSLAAIAHPWAHIRAAGHAIAAYVAALRGDLDAGRTAIATALAEAGDREPIHSDTLVDAAEIESLGGDPEMAVVTAETALARQLALGRGYQVTRARIALAAGLRARAAPGDAARADEHLTSAAALAEAGGLAHLMSRINFLRSLDGARGGPALPSPLDELGDPAHPGAVGYLRFLGVTGPRWWLRARDTARVGGVQEVAAERRRRDLVVDVVAGDLSVRDPSRAIRGRPTVAALVGYLANQHGRAVSADELYRVVWGAAEYHPLRHRNTLYTGLSRAKKALDEILPGRAVIVRYGDGWMISPGLDVCVVSRPPSR